MQQAKCLVALGGIRPGTSVPKTVTAAEAAVLMAIHGAGAVYDIEPLDEDSPRSQAEEIARLRRIYGNRNSDGVRVIDNVYPGRNPDLHEGFDELGLTEDQFKATGRVAPKPSKPKSSSKKKAPPPPVTDTNNADGLFDDGDDNDPMG